MSELRNYQAEAVESIFSEWSENDSTLCVMPTGTGKTVMFSDVIHKITPARSLVLVHREELVWQAVKKIEALGIETSVEMASLRASSSTLHRTQVVVSTVQTQCAGKNGARMTRFDPMDFGLVVCDEAHHFVSPSFKKVLDYYRTNPRLKVLGCTATPDRADEMALGKVFQSVAYDYEIMDAIHDGWLVPIEQQLVTIEGLDFSQVRTTAGDLNNADLAAVMEAEKNMQGVSSAILEIAKDKRTLVFTATVRQAELMAEILNRHRVGMADWVCGATPKEDRRRKLQEFSCGQTQVMCNCGVLTEGFDEPNIKVVVQARPTKSRCLYSQQIGRGTRPMAGIVDGWDNEIQRKKAIRDSDKPSLLVIDFVGNSGRHKLMTTADILGGKVEDEVMKRALKRAKDSSAPVRMDVLLEEEIEKMRKEAEERRNREASRKAHLIGKAKFSMKTVNPFDALEITPARTRNWDTGKTLTEKQRGLLLRQGINPEGMPYAQSKQLLNELFRRWHGNLCTAKQATLLKKHGYSTHDLKMKDASALIDALARNGWRRPPEPLGEASASPDRAL